MLFFTSFRFSFNPFKRWFNGFNWNSCAFNAYFGLGFALGIALWLSHETWGHSSFYIWNLLERKVKSLMKNENSQSLGKSLSSNMKSQSQHSSSAAVEPEKNGNILKSLGFKLAMNAGSIKNKYLILKIETFMKVLVSNCTLHQQWHLYTGKKNIEETSI